MQTYLGRIFLNREAMWLLTVAAFLDFALAIFFRFNDNMTLFIVFFIAFLMLNVAVMYLSLYLASRKTEILSRTLPFIAAFIKFREYWCFMTGTDKGAPKGEPCVSEPDDAPDEIKEMPLYLELKKQVFEHKHEVARMENYGKHNRSTEQLEKYFTDFLDAAKALVPLLRLDLDGEVSFLEQEKPLLLKQCNNDAFLEKLDITYALIRAKLLIDSEGSFDPHGVYQKFERQFKEDLEAI